VRPADGDLSDDAFTCSAAHTGEHCRNRRFDSKSLKQFLRAAHARPRDYVTLRNDRFVIPVRADPLRAVQASCNGASGTGQTVFWSLSDGYSTNQLVQFAEEEAA